MKTTGSTLGDLASQSATEVKNTGQDIAGTTRQTATSMKQSATASGQGTEEKIVFVDDMALDEGQ